MAIVKSKFKRVGFLFAGLVVFFFSFFQKTPPSWAQQAFEKPSDSDAFRALNAKVDLLINALVKEGKFSSAEIQAITQLNACVDQSLNGAGQNSSFCNLRQVQQALKLYPYQPQQAVTVPPVNLDRN